MTRRGFTAPELTMVLVLISIACCLLIRANAMATDRARDNICLSNLTQLCLGLQMYAADNDYRLPRHPKAWDPIMPYVGSSQMLKCPRAPKPEEQKTRKPPPQAGPGGYGWPGPVEPERHVESDYLLNPTVQTDDFPTVIIAGDDAPDRHSGRRWVGVRLDGATALWPAEQWREKLGEVSKYAKDSQ